MAYVQGNSVPCSNLEVLDKLIVARHELAQVVILYRSWPFLIMHRTREAFRFRKII